MGNKQVMQGNIALCEAALRAGCTFYAGYPITPQTSITEYLSYKIEEYGGSFIQAESEIAAINMVAGASAGGARAMTATSGPGFSLMAEGLSFISSMRIPAVVVNVQRGGPGGGNIKPSQSDYHYATKSLGHGGMRPFCVAPNSVQEEADWAYQAFDIAEKFNCVVILLTDGILGTMLEPVVLPAERKAPPCRTNIVTGKEGRVRKILRDFLPVQTEHEAKLKERAAMYREWETAYAQAEEYLVDDAEYIVTAWGSGARIATTAVDALRQEGVKVGLLRPITLHPFPFSAYRNLDPSQVKGILSVEMSDPPQFYEDVDRAVQGRIPLSCFTRSGGVILNPEEIREAVKANLL